MSLIENINMETNSILTANLLDILFEGRNKEYGAYELRNTYGRRVITAIGITTVTFLLLILLLSWNLEKIKSKVPLNIEVKTVVLPQDKKQEITKPVVLPYKKIVKTASYTRPVIVVNEKVLHPSAEINDLADAKIDTKTFDGTIDDKLTPPLEIRESNIIETPTKKANKEDEVFISVEKEAVFAGNWNAYVKKEIEKNIDELTEAGESGTCIVQFIVSKNGSVSNVEALTLKGTKLAEIAVNAIRKGPKWIPAEQNHTVVNAYRKQPITFTISD